MLVIRTATLDDVDAITEIYNDAIVKTVATFDTTPKRQEEQEHWFRAHGDRYPILVAEQDHYLLGWAALSPWSDRCAYAETAEVSLYVREGHRGQGIGRRLLHAIIDEGRKAHVHTVIARIADGNDVSIHLHESIGFRHIGVMREVGRKFGRLLDVYLMQLIYTD